MLYDFVRDRPFDDKGWCEAEHWSGFRRILKDERIKTVVEIGSWLGKSTRMLARLVGPRGGRVFAVDPWIPFNDGITTPEAFPEMQDAYWIFLSNIKHAGLSDVVVPIRATSMEAARNMSVTADLVYVDGAHDEQSATEDIVEWEKHLSPHGVMSGDDYCRGFPGVVRAVDRLARERLLWTRHSGRLWWWERPPSSA